MTRKQYNPFNALIQGIAMSPPGIWFFSRTLHHVDRICWQLSRGRFTMASLTSGLPLVMLTTTGAKSGLPRTVPLVCIRDERDAGSFALIATNWGQQHYPAWYFNLKANPEATCAIAGHVGRYTAHEATEAEYAHFWQTAVDTYVGYALYKQRIRGRHIPIMVMTPQAA